MAKPHDEPHHPPAKHEAEPAVTHKVYPRADEPKDPLPVPSAQERVITVGEEQMARSNEMQEMGLDNWMKAHEAKSAIPPQPAHKEPDKHAKPAA